MQFFTAILAALAVAQGAFAAPATTPANSLLKREIPAPTTCVRERETCDLYMEERYKKVQIDVQQIISIKEQIVAFIPHHEHKKFHLKSFFLKLHEKFHRFHKRLDAWFHHEARLIEKFFWEIKFKTRHACQEAHRKIIHEFKELRAELDLALDKCHNDVRLHFIELIAQIDVHLHSLEVQLSEGLRVRYLLVAEIQSTTVTDVRVEEESRGKFIHQEEVDEDSS